MRFKIGVDNLLRRCVTQQEALKILWHFHNSPFGGHFNGGKNHHKNTASKILLDNYI